MKSTLRKKRRTKADSYPAPIEEILPKVELIDDDGEPMESDWHVKAMLLLISCTDWWFRDRDDFYVGGNMFIYFSERQARNNDFRGPDYFFVKNTRRKPLRKYWATWLEDGRTPDTVIELCSRSTITEDYGPKKIIYQNTLHVSDYFCYDPESRKLDGWRLIDRTYVALKPNEHGRLWSEELGLWVGIWKGKVGPFDDTWLRFYDREGNLVLSEVEGAEQHAEEERLRRQAAEAEVVELRAQMAARNGKRKKQR